MTDKQIIIDGINVSELTGEQLVCMNRYEVARLFAKLVDVLSKTEDNYNNAQEDRVRMWTNNTGLTAKLKRKEQECEELKKQIESDKGLITNAGKQNYQLVQEYDQLKASKEQAEQEAEKILIRRQLEDIARRLNKGEEIDWDNREQLKHCIELYGNDIITNFYFAHKSQGTVYCLDGNFKDIAIREIGEERLKAYLRGE